MILHRFRLQVVDAFTGKDVQLGETLRDPHGRRWRLAAVLRKGLLRADAVVVFPDEGPAEVVVPLSVRFFHPARPLQLVGFVPT